MATKQITPEVTWAQRSSASDATKNFLYVTISVPDVTDKEMKLDIRSTGLTFTGYSDSKKATYHVALDFYSEIDPAQSKTHHSDRGVELKLQKKELKEEFWPRLLKDNKKMHFLKTDFDKWVDEDEQDGAADDDMMNQFGGGSEGMGGMGGMGGMAGMGGMGGEGGFGGLDFSKLGGAGGMPDLSALGGMGGMGGMGDFGGAGDDSDDEDMPELEDQTKGASSASAGSSKIEEVE